MLNGELRRRTVWTVSLLVGGFILAGSITAEAADFGGNCCADLEERIAELEATTARKGNRKVSLSVYGDSDGKFCNRRALPLTVAGSVPVREV